MYDEASLKMKVFPPQPSQLKLPTRKQSSEEVHPVLMIVNGSFQMMRVPKVEYEQERTKLF